MRTGAAPHHLDVERLRSRWASDDDALNRRLIKALGQHHAIDHDLDRAGRESIESLPSDLGVCPAVDGRRHDADIIQGCSCRVGELHGRTEDQAPAVGGVLSVGPGDLSGCIRLGEDVGEFVDREVTTMDVNVIEVGLDLNLNRTEVDEIPVLNHFEERLLVGDGLEDAREPSAVRSFRGGGHAQH